MDNAVFVLEEGTNKWLYKNFMLYQIKDYRWEIQYDNVLHVCESIYDILNYFSKNFNLNPVFKLPEAVYNMPSSCSC